MLFLIIFVTFVGVCIHAGLCVFLVDLLFTFFATLLAGGGSREDEDGDNNE